MNESPFLERLEAEFQARREKNPRYSLRAFAAFLGTDHSTLSQILRKRRRLPSRSIRTWGRKLGMSTEEAAVYIAAEHTADARSTQRLEQLRHWTAEAMAIISDRSHWGILRLVRQPGFVPDCRNIALKLGVSADAVNMAVSRLLSLGLLELSQDAWKDLTGARLTEAEFRKMALKRVKEKAAKDHIRL